MVARQRLRDEHSVERIAQRTWKRASPRGVIDAYGQPLKAFKSYLPNYILGQCLGCRQLANPMP